MSEPEDPTRTCAHCGATSSRADIYCPSCGQAFIPAPEEPSARQGEPAADPSDRAGSRQDASRQPGWNQPGVPSGGTPMTGPTAESRNWALAAHLTALAGVFLGGLPAFLGPLVIWLLRRDQGDAFATEHARSALNFNLSVLAYVILAVVLSIVTLGLALIVVLPLLLVAFVAYLVITVQAAVAASQGRPFSYPLAIRFVQ